MIKLFFKTETTATTVKEKGKFLGVVRAPYKEYWRYKGYTYVINNNDEIEEFFKED